MRIIKGSLFAIVFKKAYLIYCGIENRIIKCFQNSYSCSSLKKTFKLVMAILKYSYLGRITEINSNLSNPIVLFKSRVSDQLIGIIKKNTHILKISLTARKIENIKNEFRLSPLRSIAIVLIPAIITDLAFYLIINQKIGIDELALRGLFLIIATACLSSNVDLTLLTNNSLFLKYVRNLWQDKRKF